MTDAADAALERLEAPRDPREDWDLPPRGEMERHKHLDEVVTRVLAPNPSLMTLDGTNTYVVGAPGRGEAVVVDPGPDDPDHRGRVEQVLADRDAECVLVLVTHHHVDHAAAARSWAQRFGCAVAAPTRSVAGPEGRIVGDGDTLEYAGVRFHALATPGHTADHTCYRLDHGPLLTGDHVLGRGTAVVLHPDGDLLDYLDSLRRVLELDTQGLYPGHGPELVEDPHAVLRFYLEHRRFRQRQILALLDEDGPQKTAALVRRIYADVDPGLLSAAEASTRAALEKLDAEGIVRLQSDGTVALVGSPDQLGREGADS